MAEGGLDERRANFAAPLHGLSANPSWESVLRAPYAQPVWNLIPVRLLSFLGTNLRNPGDTRDGRYQQRKKLTMRQMRIW